MHEEFVGQTVGKKRNAKLTSEAVVDKTVDREGLRNWRGGGIGRRRAREQILDSPKPPLEERVEGEDCLTPIQHSHKHNHPPGSLRSLPQFPDLSGCVSFPLLGAEEKARYLDLGYINAFTLKSTIEMRLFFLP